MTDRSQWRSPGKPLRGLWKLTWLEIKIFLREPMGAFGTLGIPLLTFVVLGRVLGRSGRRQPRIESLLQDDLPILVVILLALSSVLSLVAIISIYRENGILKRLRATPLSPLTILTSHVIVKLLLTALTLGLLALVGRRFYPGELQVAWPSFVLALLLVTVSILSIGFVIASIVPTARFARPLGGMLLYPQIAISGLFLPLDALPAGWRLVAEFSPLAHSVTLLRGIWTGGRWLDHIPEVAALVIGFMLCTAVASRIFRWQ